MNSNSRNNQHDLGSDIHNLVDHQPDDKEGDPAGAQAAKNLNINNMRTESQDHNKLTQRNKSELLLSRGRRQS